MGEKITLTDKSNGFSFSAWHSKPTDVRRGGLVICHAIWGVTPHLRALADAWAQEGYEVLLPNLFERYRPEWPAVDTDPALFDQQMDYGSRVQWGAKCLKDLQATIDALEGPVFMIGFCFGGTAAWIASAWCRGLAAVACFYGGNIIDYIDDSPVHPTILHFGKQDELIPPAHVEAIEEAYPDMPIFRYDAGHAFVAPSGFDADAARLSRLRTLQLFSRYTGRGEA